MNPKQNYIITKRIQETRNVVVINLEPEQGEVFDFQPGQFVMVHQYHDDKTTWRKLPYSLCTSPTEKKYIQLCFRVDGEFTQALSDHREGSVVGISGPFGRFIFDEKQIPKLVMLAGGIGIAPFMSTIRYATEKQLSNNIQLLYGNQSPNDIAYKNDLQILDAKNSNFHVVYAVDDPAPGWKGDTGYIRDELLKKYCHPLRDKYFFLCGPPAFVDAMQELLPECGVKPEFIKTEKF